MRLGLTNSTYQYLFARTGGMFPNRESLEFSTHGQPTPYFLQTPRRIDPGQALEWLIEKCVRLELPVVHAGIARWDDPAYLERLKGLLARHSLELMPAVGANLIEGGEATRRSVEAAQDSLRRYREFGGIAVSKFCTTPMIHSRFTTSPPLDEQLGRIKEHVRPIVEVARECGIVLAFENHLDYRVRELVEVIEAVDSPHLRLLFDTGNTLTVCEDPVDAARDGARYTALVHLKDLRVHPWTPGREFESVMYAAPLGRGHDDNRKILEILRRRAPNPDRLVLSLELMPVPPNEDEDRWVDESIAYAKREFAAYLRA
jgi:sugar phosphate isomerase/epimerase